MAWLKNHNLILQVDSPVILLRNINDHFAGLRNGTRFDFDSIWRSVNNVNVLSGKNVGEVIDSNYISITPSDDPRMAIQILWRQSLQEFNESPATKKW